MNETRATVAKKAYKIMDSDGSGQVDINDIRQTYNPKQHPDVKAVKNKEKEESLSWVDEKSLFSS
jgi:hypothetical protein